jgi:hypothetical protein
VQRLHKREVFLPTELTYPEGPVRAVYDRFIRDRDHVELCWVGGIGCSKSDALVTKVGLVADAYPRSVTVLARSDSVKLALTTRQKFLDKWGAVGRFAKSENIFYWPNGSKTIFLGLGDEKAIERLKSLEAVVIAIDEADEVDEDVIEMAIGRIRQQSPSWGSDVYRAVILVANYEGRNWIWRRYKAEEERNGSRGRLLLEASTYDNHSLPPDYVKKLETANGAEFVRRYVKGSWDAATGLIYPEFDNNLHIRPAPLDPPADWIYVTGIDHGFRAPTAGTVWGIDARGYWHGIKEYYETGLIPAENARNIKIVTASLRVQAYVIDPSTFNVDPRDPGKSIASDYIAAGLPVVRGNNQLESGIGRVRELIRPFTQPDGLTRASKFSVDPSMVNTIREFQEWKWKDVRDAGRERPESGHDHALDSFRYCVMHVPPETRASLTPNRLRFDDDPDEEEDRPRNRKRKRGPGGY